MTSADWSSVGGGDCIRLTGLPDGADVRVFPVTSAPVGGLPPMAGRLVPDGADLCFVPRFPFLDGTSYTVTVSGARAAVLARPRPGRPHQTAGTKVTGIWPMAAEVPVNLLRLYVWFSAPMSEGYAARQVRLARDDGSVLAGALLPTEDELWDAGRRRLTVLLDPARIKRGLPGHGYPLRPGEPFRLIVGTAFPDALGFPLGTPAQRRYHVGGEERRHVTPGDWELAVPAVGTAQPLRVTFDRPLDHGLLERCLQVTGPDGRPVLGTARVGHEERSWQLAPSRDWAPGEHQLIVDPVLEDLAGNSVSRVFDRDLARPQDEPRPARPVTVVFRPGYLTSG
jgi:hypothetical protein